MEVFNVSQDDDEGDTSEEELEEEDESVRRKIKQTSENELCTKFQKYARKESELFKDKGAIKSTDKFQFFLLDCVSTVSTRDFVSFDQTCTPIENTCKETIETQRLVMRLMGSSQNGESLCCNVHGFIPYFYAFPSNCFSEDDIPHFTNMLNEAVKADVLQSLFAVPFHDFVNSHPAIVKVEMSMIQDEKSIYQFHMTSNRLKRENVCTILKIFCALPKFVWIAAKVLKSRWISYPFTNDPCEYDLYENSINNNLRFLAHCNISGGSWLEISNFSVRDSHNLESHAQIEMDVHYSNVAKVCPTLNADLYNTIPPFRILSFDIEVLINPAYSIPRHGQEPVIQIGNVISVYGKEEPLTKVIFTLNTCDPIKDADVIEFVPDVNTDDASSALLKTEADMLNAWRQFVVAFDPDVITGFNNKQFDVPYLFNRSEILNSHLGMRDNVFPFLGRLKNIPMTFRDLKNQLKWPNTYEYRLINLHGRVLIDMLGLVHKHDIGSPRSRGSFSLASVSKRHLKKHLKGDVHFSEIPSLQNGNSGTRRRLAEYCVQDSYLPLRLMLLPVFNAKDKGDFLRFYIQKSCSENILIKYIFGKSTFYHQYCKQVSAEKRS